jgi:hypothetical protein
VKLTSLVFGASPSALRKLQEQFSTVAFVDLTCESMAHIREAYRLAQTLGPVGVYVVQRPLPKTLTEAWVREAATIGLLRSELPATTVSTFREIRRCLTALVEANGAADKQPTEVDRMKFDQSKEKLSLRKRQDDELLHAKERELERKERDDLAKLDRGDKKPSLSR